MNAACNKKYDDAYAKHAEAISVHYDLFRQLAAKYCKWCKAASGAYLTHDTTECCRFDKDGKEVGKPSKPFESAKKPWKKGGSDSGQMAYLTKKFEKLKKKLKKSKKAAKKRARDSWIVIPTVTRIVGTVA